MRPDSRQRAARRPRGQAAAMMAVTMMLIVVMVCLTLGIGMKAREKAETQTLADASAYSGAVVTARTFNSIALLNRVSVAEMVSMIATQSLVSYAGYYRTMLHAALAEYQIKRANCVVDSCLWCDKWDALINAANADLANHVEPQWTGQDGATNTHVQTMQGGAGDVYGAQLALYDDLMNNQLTGATPGLTNAVVQQVNRTSKWQGELTAPAASNAVNLREVGVAADCDTTADQPVCKTGSPREVALKATMGSRWYSFETNAANLSSTVEDALLLHHGIVRVNGEDVRINLYEGSTRFVGGQNPHGPPGTMGLLGEALHGTMTITLKSPGGCSDTVGATEIRSFVYTSSIDNNDATHVFEWTLSNGTTGQLTPEPVFVHALGPCPPLTTPPCGMWPGYVDLNPGHLDPSQNFKHLYGQPKVTAVVQRDYRFRGNRADPWNLLYNVNIRTSDTEQFDNNGLVTAQNVDISRQTAIATGLVYYHRMNHWREPPNYFNPYWRATLVSGAIDLQGNPSRGGTDLQTAAGNAPFAQDVITKLAARGFRGWQ